MRRQTRSSPRIWSQPLEEAVIRFHVSNVKVFVTDTNTLLNIDRPMGKTSGAGIRLADMSAVHVKRDDPVHQWAQ
jgi:hypothetical protein